MVEYREAFASSRCWSGPVRLGVTGQDRIRDRNTKANWARNLSDLRREVGFIAGGSARLSVFHSGFPRSPLPLMSIWDSLKRFVAGERPRQPTISSNPTSWSYNAFHDAPPDPHAIRLERQLEMSTEGIRRPVDPERYFQYLGDGVSYELNQTDCDIDRLKSLGLPVFETPEPLAAAIGFSPRRLRWLAYHHNETRSSHYIHHEIAKKSGGTRKLAAPRPQVAACCRWIQREILSELPTHEAAHGFVPGRSTVTAAAPHVGKQVLLNLDLSDFFPTITFPRVRGWYASLGYSGQVATVLALLCTESPRVRAFPDVENPTPLNNQPFWRATGPRQLPQGACTSPTISNLICRSMDRRLTGLCHKLGWTYTRYADDLSFSASGEPSRHVGYLIHRIGGIVREERFQINEKKTRVQRSCRRQTVTGLVVNDRVGVPRETIRRIRAILHRARTEGLAAQNREGHPDFHNWLCGMIGYISAADPGKGDQLRRAYDAILANETNGNVDPP